MNSNLTSVQNSWLKNFFEINSFGEIIGSDQLRIESSQRKFCRIKSSKNSLILMIVPPGIEDSVSSFVTKGNYFHKYNINVPQIYASDEDLGLILVEDFGDKIYQFNIGLNMSNKDTIVDVPTVNKIARLSRLDIPEVNKESLTNDLNNILGFVAQLDEVDTSNVEPLASVTGHKLPLRSDDVNDGNIEDLVLKNAPESSSGFFVVPKVIE